MPKNQQDPESIYRILRSKGAPETCHVMSDGELDGRDMPLREALEETVWQFMGTFVPCIPGKLAYFEGEETGERYILEYPQPRDSLRP